MKLTIWLFLIYLILGSSFSLTCDGSNCKYCCAIEDDGVEYCTKNPINCKNLDSPLNYHELFYLLSIVLGSFLGKFYNYTIRTSTIY